MRAISAARTMNCRAITTIFTAALFFAPVLAEDELEEESFPAESETELSPAAAAALDAAWVKLEQLVELLAAVVDAESAAALVSQIGALYTELRQADASVLDDEDVEVMAAEFEELFLRLDAERVRLEDADCFGCAELAEHFCLSEPAVESDATAAPRIVPVEEAEAPAPEAGTESPLR